MSKYTGPVCRGSWALGTACKRCERCIETKPSEKQDMGVVTDADRELRQAILVFLIESMGRPCSKGDMIDDRNDELDAIIARHRLASQADQGVEAVRSSMDNAIAQMAADAIRASFFTSVSGGGRYYLSLAYRSMDEMYKAEDEIKAFTRWLRFLPLEQRLATHPQPSQKGEGDVLL